MTEDSTQQLANTDTTTAAPKPKPPKRQVRKSVAVLVLLCVTGLILYFWLFKPRAIGMGDCLACGMG